MSMLQCFIINTSQTNSKQPQDEPRVDREIMRKKQSTVFLNICSPAQAGSWLLKDQPLLIDGIIHVPPHPPVLPLHVPSLPIKHYD